MNNDRTFELKEDYIIPAGTMITTCDSISFEGGETVKYAMVDSSDWLGSTLIVDTNYMEGNPERFTETTSQAS